MKVGVLYGGRSRERFGALIPGREVADALHSLGHDVVLIDPAISILENELQGVDVAFLVLNGRYGEDGKIQGYLEMKRIPYTGPGILASAIAMDKSTTSAVLLSAGLAVPDEVQVDLTTAVNPPKPAWERSFVKPAGEGSSIGASIANGQEELAVRLEELRGKGFDRVLIQRFIRGVFLSVGIWPNEAGQETPTPVLAIETPDAVFYDSDAKLLGKARHSCPADLPPSLTEYVQALALRAHRAIGCHGLSRTDFILDERDGPIVLELNTTPGMIRSTRFLGISLMAAAQGQSYESMIERILSTAFTRPTDGAAMGLARAQLASAGMSSMAGATSKGLWGG